MAETKEYSLMKLNQISVFLENKPGALSKVCRVLSEHQIDISTMSMAETEKFGILRMIIREWEKAAALLKENGFGVTVTDVVALEVDDRPGGMCQVLDALDRYSIKVEYLYAFVSPLHGKAVVILRFDAPDAVLERLMADPEVRIVTMNEIFTGK